MRGEDVLDGDVKMDVDAYFEKFKEDIDHIDVKTLEAMAVETVKKLVENYEPSQKSDRWKHVLDTIDILSR
ncbi:hypothetical protein ACFL6S_37680 [Candidatus Poribacteria bacterium]